MEEPFDDTTLASFKNGDPLGFKKIYIHFYHPLCYFAEKLTGDRMEAEDIVLETFTRFFNRYENFETYTNIRAFLFISVRNASLNNIKATKRLTIKQKEFSSTLDREENMEDELVEGEVLQAIYTAVELLPRECKKVFKLIYIEGMKHAEIAALLDITVSTVRNHRKRAIQLLRSNLTVSQFLTLGWILCMELLHFYQDSGKLLRS